MTVMESPANAVDDVAGRLFNDGLGAYHLATVYLGHRLGLFRALAERSGQTAQGLAASMALDLRYVSEWLQAEVIAGLVEASTEDLAEASFRLAPGVTEVLVEETHPAYLGGLGWTIAAIGRVLPDLLAAFRNGAGVPYEAYGEEAVEAQAVLNRPAYVNDLAAHWIPALPDVDERLRDATRPARVADIGCGVGWAAIEFARAFPAARIDGFDSDARSIAAAKANAHAAGVSDRVTFHLADGSRGALGSKRYDLIVFLEALHDFPRPVEALAAAREAVVDEGAVIVMDEGVGESRPAPGDPIETFLATASVLWCLPQAQVDPTSEATGTILRPSTLEAIARGAGWAGFEVAPIEHPMWRFYRLTRD